MGKIKNNSPLNNPGKQNPKLKTFKIKVTFLFIKNFEP